MKGGMIYPLKIVLVTTTPGLYKGLHTSGYEKYISIKFNNYFNADANVPIFVAKL